MAVLYQALFLKSSGTIGPRQADKLELWEIAVLLKAKYNDTPNTSGSKTTTSEDPNERYRLIRERVAHSKGLGPPPTVRPVGKEMLADLGEAFG